MSSWQCLTCRDLACYNSIVVLSAGANLPLLLQSWTKINAMRISFLQSPGVMGWDTMSRKTTGSPLDAGMDFGFLLNYFTQKETAQRRKWEELSERNFPS